MYKKKRAELMAKAEQCIENNDLEGFAKIKAEVEQLDAEHKKVIEAKKDFEALNKETFGLSPFTNGGEAINTSGEKTVAPQISDWKASVEYRLAFMNFATGATASIPDKFTNAAETTVTGDVAVVIPTTILNRIVERMENVGKIWNRITKTTYKGGVRVPTSSVKPVAKFVAERGTQEAQKKTVGSITFGYYKLICKVAISFEVSVVTLDIFETKLAENIADAMIKELELKAVNGLGEGAPEGVLNKTPVEGQNIEIAADKEITYADIAAMEGALPEEYDSGAVWNMTKKTFFNCFVGMTDLNGNPVIKEIVGVNGKPSYYLLGREVLLLNSDYVPTYSSSAEADAVVAFIYDWSDYVGNTNYEITIREYIDEETDDRIKKSLMLYDGKPVDIGSLVTMTKKASAG